MRYSICSSFTTLLIWAALSASAAFGQSLSIIKKGESNYWVEASAPADNPHTLQASANLHLWVDVREDVQESFSLQLTNSGSSQRYFRLRPSTAVDPIRI